MLSLSPRGGQKVSPIWLRLKNMHVIVYLLIYYYLQVKLVCWCLLDILICLTWQTNVLESTCLHSRLFFISYLSLMFMVCISHLKYNSLHRIKMTCTHKRFTTNNAYIHVVLRYSQRGLFDRSLPVHWFTDPWPLLEQYDIYTYNTSWYCYKIDEPQSAEVSADCYWSLISFIHFQCLSFIYIYMCIIFWPDADFRPV